jgi:hypothetical protein
MWPIGCLETSAHNYQYMLRNVLEEWRSQSLPRGESRKSRKLWWILSEYFSLVACSFTAVTQQTRNASPSACLCLAKFCTFSLETSNVRWKRKMCEEINNSAWFTKSVRMYIARVRDRICVFSRITGTWDVSWRRKFAYVHAKCYVGPYINKCKGKGKAVPLQAWTGPQGSRRSRLPDF